MNPYDDLEKAIAIRYEWFDIAARNRCYQVASEHLADARKLEAVLAEAKKRDVTPRL